VKTVESQRHKDCICLGELLLDTQAGWFLRPDCAPRSECPQFGMPAKRHAQFHVPNVPTSRISERTSFRIYEHAQCRVFRHTSLQRAYVIPCHKWGRLLCYGHDAARWGLQRAGGACGGRIALDGGVASILALWR